MTVSLSDMSLEQLKALKQKRSLDDIPLSELSLSELEQLKGKKTKEEETKSLHSTDDWDAYLWNSAKLGLGDSISMASGLVDTMIVDPIKNIIEDPSIVTDPESYGLKNIPFTDESRLGEKFIKSMSGTQADIAKITGADPSLTTEDDALRYLGRGVRTMTDLPGYIGAPVKAASMIQRAGALGVIGSSAEFGGDVGAELEEEWTGEDTGTGRLVGGLGFGLLPTVATSTTARVAVDPVKQIWAKYKFIKANPGLAETQYATGAAKRLLKLIAKEQGVDDIDDIVKEFNRLGKYIDGKELPLLVAMSDNPVVTSQVQRLAKTDEGFRHEVNLELKRLSGQIDQKSNNIFGDRDFEVKDMQNVPEALHKKINYLVNEKYTVDNKIEDLGLKFIPKMSAKKQGEAIRDLVVKRERIVKAKLSPLYTELKKEAKLAGAEIDQAGVNAIYTHVKANKLSDIFGVGTKLDNKINKYTSPQKSVNKATGMPEMIQPTMSFEHLDSLKRAINELKRKPLSDTEMRKLYDLDDVIREARMSVKGGYSQRLDALDKQYYQEMGVPFNTASVKEIGMKKYADEVAPVILKNESALEAFLDVAGPEGHVIARNAYMSKVYDKVVKEGEINTSALKAMMKKDKDMINRVPGLKGEVEDALVYQGSLLLKRADLNEGLKLAEDEIAKNFLITSNLEPHYYDVVNRAIRDHTYMDKVYKDLGEIDSVTAHAVTRRIQREFVEVALESSGGAYKFITDPRKATTVRKMFKDNPEYISQVRDLSKLSDAINKADVTKLSSLVLNERLDWLAAIMPGVDGNYAFSQLRDRISSDAMKAFRIMSRMNQAKTKAKVDNQIKEILLNPKGLSDLSRAGRAFDFKIDNPLKWKKIMNIISETLPSYIYASTKPALIREEDQTKQKIQ